MDWLALMCCAHENTHTLYVPLSRAHSSKIPYEIFTLWCSLASSEVNVMSRRGQHYIAMPNVLNRTRNTAVLTKNTDNLRSWRKKIHKNKSFLPKPLIWLKLWVLTRIKELQAQLWWAWLLNNMVINTTINQSPWQDLQFRRDQPK